MGIRHCRRRTWLSRGCLLVALRLRLPFRRHWLAVGSAELLEAILVLLQSEVEGHGSLQAHLQHRALDLHDLAVDNIGAHLLRPCVLLQGAQCQPDDLRIRAHLAGLPMPCLLDHVCGSKAAPGTKSQGGELVGSHLAVLVTTEAGESRMAWIVACRWSLLWRGLVHAHGNEPAEDL